jgi:predicted phosphodiesterase
MKRTKKLDGPAPDLILTADWHLREDTPVCYIGDWIKDQWDAVDFVRVLQYKYGCPVYHSGDLFHYWKPSPDLLSEASQRIPDDFFTVAGNHDLPMHSMELIKKSGLYNLMINNKALLLELGTDAEGCSWNQLPSNNVKFNPMKVLVWHVMTYQGAEPWPGCTDPKAMKLLRKYDAYNLIVTGDNHKSFVEVYEGRLLVNPGSLTRQTAAQIDHRPSVYLYYALTNTVKRVEIPIPDNVISREHLDFASEKNARIESFISKLNSNYQVSMNFEDNLERFRKKNKVKDSIMQIIYKSIE